MATIHRQPAGESHPLIGPGLDALILLGMLAFLGISSGLFAGHTGVLVLGIAFAIACVVVYLVLKRRKPYLWLGDDGALVRTGREEEFVPYHAIERPSVEPVKSKGDVVHWDLQLTSRRPGYRYKTYGGKELLKKLYEARRAFDATTNVDTSLVDRFLTSGGAARVGSLQTLVGRESDFEDDKVQGLLAIVEHPAVLPSQRAAAAIALQAQDRRVRSRISSSANRPAPPLLRTTLERSCDSTTDPIDLGAALDSLLEIERRITIRHGSLPWRFVPQRDASQPYRAT